MICSLTFFFSLSLFFSWASSSGQWNVPRSQTWTVFLQGQPWRGMDAYLHQSSLLIIRYNGEAPPTQTHTFKSWIHKTAGIFIGLGSCDVNTV